MTHKENILLFLSNLNGKICDDCIAHELKMKRRQIAYKNCTELENNSKISRGYGSCSYCHKYKKVSSSDLNMQNKDIITSTKSFQSLANQENWYWEGNVQDAILKYLVNKEYKILSVSDTSARAQGIDIKAISSNRRETWISVKGYPNKSEYSQARQWFAVALFDLIRYRTESSDVDLTIGLPDGFSTYLNLVPRVKWLKVNLPFKFFWVSENGEIREE